METEHCDAFDYWGKGTQVTVSTAATTPLTLLTLMNCGTPSNDIYSLAFVLLAFLTHLQMDRRQWESADGLCPVPSSPERGNLHRSQSAPQCLGKLKVFQLFCGSCWRSVINIPISKLPTVSLLSAPIGTTQYLMCIIEDFTPKKVIVTWKKNDMEVEGQTPTVGLQPSGLYSASSLLKVTNTDWNNKVKYSCVVEHQGQPTNETISKTEPLTVTLNPPSVKKVFIDNQAVLDCVITATDQDTVSGTTITWHVNGKKQKDHIDLKPIESKGNLNSRVSTLTIDQTRWTNLNKVQCSAMKRGEVTQVIQDLSFNKGSEAPSVSVHILPEEDTREKEIVTLVCLVVSPSLCDVYIIWKVNSALLRKPRKATNSVTSVFTTTKKEWEGNSVFTCAVKHLGSDNNTTPEERSVSKSLANILLTEPEAGFALSCTDNFEDEFSSLWSTTSSFIILFLLSLSYSTGLSLVKMKQ
ncbi:unnamed protein product [Oncorhynchus mykiss]|uniref:Ig-like domain-containing protein n=1 Tax=Oncorhynchus mykiss TaxID=8022 RepID=A0A060Y2Y9_ONCMY|nr:unnamed protein product [Oncorhynchus mykiss]